MAVCVEHIICDALLALLIFMIWNVYLIGWYGSVELVHVIIKNEHYNIIHALAFLLRWEKVKNQQSDQCITNYVFHAVFQTKYAMQNVVLQIIKAERYALISNSTQPSDN
jgi:hypothetical protein